MRVWLIKGKEISVGQRKLAYFEMIKKKKEAMKIQILMPHLWDVFEESV